MSALKWIYDSRTTYGTTVRRFGSRKYGLVANWMSGDEHLSASVIGTVWRLHFGAGPYEGIASGWSYANVRGHIFSLPGGRGLGIGWGPR